MIGRFETEDVPYTPTKINKNPTSWEKNTLQVFKQKIEKSI